MSKFVNFSKSCRLCLNEAENDEQLIDSSQINVKLFALIEIFTTIMVNQSHFDYRSVVNSILNSIHFHQIQIDDGLPQRICSKCFDSLTFMQNFREKSIKSDEAMRRQLNNEYDINDNNPIGEFQDNDNKLTNGRAARTRRRACKTFNASQNAIQSFTKTENFRDGVSVKLEMEIVQVNGTSAEEVTEDDEEEPFVDRVNVETSNAPPETAKISSASKKNLLPCDTCGKMLKKYDLAHHMNIHLGLRPFACTIEDCGKTFTSPSHLQKHVKITHGNNYPYKCDICSKQFKVMTTYKIHRSYHGDPQIPCEICGKLLRN